MWTIFFVFQEKCGQKKVKKKVLETGCALNKKILKDLTLKRLIFLEILRSTDEAREKSPLEKYIINYTNSALF